MDVRIDFKTEKSNKSPRWRSRNQRAVDMLAGKMTVSAVIITFWLLNQLFWYGAPGWDRLSRAFTKNFAGLIKEEKWPPAWKDTLSLLRLIQMCYWVHLKKKVMTVIVISSPFRATNRVEPALHMSDKTLQRSETWSENLCFGFKTTQYCKFTLWWYSSTQSQWFLALRPFSPRVRLKVYWRKMPNSDGATCH